MSILTFQSVHKDFGIKEILQDASFSIGDREKVGLIGTNGSGKSTLLKMIAGVEPIDSGDRWVNPGSKVVYLPQQPSLDDDKTVLEQVFADSSEQMSLVREYEDLSHRLGQAQGNELDRLMNQMAGLNEAMETTNAWDLETNAKIILTQLGIEDFEAKIATLSGGYRKRIALATALLSAPDLLLMDEPTNHLDAESVEWLQTYLQGHRGSILLVTHDRYFLDQVTNRILEIDRGDLYTYDGNYVYYLEKKAEADSVEVSRQRKHTGVLRRELEWLKRGPKARSTKQKARIDRIQDMRDTEFKQTQGKVEMATAGRRIGKKVIELAGVSKAYGDRTLISDFTYEFSPRDRVGIIGANGAGKSTLMNLITGRTEPDSGTVEIGGTIHIGYFDQHSEHLLDALNQEQRVIDYIKDIAAYVTTADGSLISASQMLERFLFNPNQQYAPIHKLSGGEKRRLFLLQVLMAAPNVLILDEPTNDLDVQTLSILEDYLENFNGCVITVSHDRYFLDRTVNRLFAFEGDGVIRQYPGNYSVYLDFKKRQADDNAIAPSVSAPAQNAAASLSAPPASARSRKLSYKEKRELEQLETQIPKLEAEKADLEKSLYQNQKSASGYSQLQDMTARLAELNSKIDHATERWLELSEVESS
ncbi:MAG: ABC-F family ATP-binding cassette domain-containing protein [Leptolyngbyaceae cyanobacterium SM1_1_3]|nr:ABC-F family ATP-binding cassette domain-containing protein [Leptolyngbyaceae cyanobacterium SM1_1_3]NJN02154.1 ABC-F family ATP-binding cassette domain-containing protein [Leptolyngbyaceae cyanobacterium RM1_1_2]NJO08964.1 ABC-F family ATP-binding cassette domain-containing protein [Leptolyngbyaceae cyanobacterium SL_1_1]